jgi:hypothetical protein
LRLGQDGSTNALAQGSKLAKKALRDRYAPRIWVSFGSA